MVKGTWEKDVLRGSCGTFILLVLAELLQTVHLHYGTFIFVILSLSLITR